MANKKFAIFFCIKVSFIKNKVLHLRSVLEKHKKHHFCSKF